MFVDGGLNLFLGARADDLLFHLSADENQQRRDAADVVSDGRSDVLVDIHLCDFHAAGVGLSELVDERSNDLARAAPCGPEVDEDGLFRLQDDGVKVLVSCFNDGLRTKPARPHQYQQSGAPMRLPMRM
jgi:hypothetical protein